MAFMRVRDKDGNIKPILAIKGEDGKTAYEYALEGGYTGNEEEFIAKMAQEKLPNPKSLTFSGAASDRYDGSSEVNIYIPEIVQPNFNAAAGQPGHILNTPSSMKNPYPLNIGRTSYDGSKECSIDLSLCVNVTEQEDGTFISDKTFEDISAAYNDGKYIFCALKEFTTINASILTLATEGNFSPFSFYRVTSSNGIIRVKSVNFTSGSNISVRMHEFEAANKKNSVFYIIGNSTAAGIWAGTCSDITAYYDGLSIVYKTNIAGISDGTTLNINGLGAVSVVRNTTTKITTHYGVGSILFLTYTIDSDGTRYWKIADYDSDTKTMSSNKTNSKMYLIGATTQSTSGQTTYSNSNCYIGANNRLYSGGEVVPNISEITALINEQLGVIENGTY